MTTPVKIPKMPKAEYDSLIKRQHVSRIAFAAAEHPYINPCANAKGYRADCSC